FTALMVLDLSREGEIDLNEDFRVYLPDAMPNITERITVAQLITHTSGIRDVYDLFFLTNATWYETDFDNRTALGLLKTQKGLNFEPGSDYLYSNSNYILLAEIIAAVTGERFPEYATTFLNARGMDQSSARRRHGVIIPNLARAYGDYGSGWIENADIANTHGDGFMFATLQDLLHWETQVWGGTASLPLDLVRDSQAPIPNADSAAYGFGLEFGFYRGLPIIYHEGSTGSYNTYVLRFPNHNLSIVTTGNTNQVNAVALARKIANFMLEEAFQDGTGYPTGPKELTALPDAESYLGLYEFDDGNLLTLTERDGELYREMEWSDPVRMVYERDNLFHYETDPSLKLAIFEQENAPTRIEVYSPNQSPQYARLIQAAPNGESYARGLEATFYNDETDTEIILEHYEGNEFQMIKNGRPRTLKLMGNDYLVWNSYRITVLRDEVGVVRGLSVDRGRIKNVLFTRID
ncbi:MAG: serine hydrolase domain-containing protein, partial [Pseudomonadota bacterium]